MPLKDILAALVVIVVWGANFVVIKVASRVFCPRIARYLRCAHT